MKHKGGNLAMLWNALGRKGKKHFTQIESFAQSAGISINTESRCVGKCLRLMAHLQCAKKMAVIVAVLFLTGALVAAAKSRCLDYQESKGKRPRFSVRGLWFTLIQAGLTFVASKPFRPWAGSYSTAWPSLRVLKPSIEMFE